MYKFKQNDIVRFDDGAIIGTGKICGVAVAPLPVIGAGYIIEVHEMNVANDYTHIAMFEYHISLK